MGKTCPEQRRRKKYHSLYGQLLERPRLRSAFQRVKANGGAPGSDGVTIEAFEADLENQITQLISELRQKVYHPQPIRRVEIPKRNGGKRPLGIPSVRDRVVQENLRDILEKIFDKTFSEHSHGFRPNRSQFTALRDLWIQIRKGGVLIVDVDVEKCFDTIPHQALIDEVAKEVADGSVLDLIEIFLTAPIKDGYRYVWPKQGTPQGSPMSPLLANIYLAKLDRHLKAKRMNFVRYADDLRATTGKMWEAREIKEEIEKGLKRIGLKMNLAKTKLITIDRGVNFLGFRLNRFKGKLYSLVPRDRVHAFREQVKAWTRRNSHLTMTERLNRLAEYVEGWGEYYKRAQQPKLFHNLDRWIYRRVIAMMAGRWRTKLYRKYPIKYFRRRGLVSLFRMHSEYFNGPWVPGQLNLPLKCRWVRKATSLCSA